MPFHEFRDAPVEAGFADNTGFNEQDGHAEVLQQLADRFGCVGSPMGGVVIEISVVQYPVWRAHEYEPAVGENSNRLAEDVVGVFDVFNYGIVGDEIDRTSVAGKKSFFEVKPRIVEFLGHYSTLGTNT